MCVVYLILSKRIFNAASLPFAHDTNTHTPTHRQTDRQTNKLKQANFFLSRQGARTRGKSPLKHSAQIHIPNTGARIQTHARTVRDKLNWVRDWWWWLRLRLRLRLQLRWSRAANGRHTQFYQGAKRRLHKHIHRRSTHIHIQTYANTPGEQ